MHQFVTEDFYEGLDNLINNTAKKYIENGLKKQEAYLLISYYLETRLEAVNRIKENHSK